MQIRHGHIGTIRILTGLLAFIKYFRLFVTHHVSILRRHEPRPDEKQSCHVILFPDDSATLWSAHGPF